MRTSPFPPFDSPAAPRDLIPTWRSFVAIGDSFTEGMCDEDPAEPGRFVGWADRLAAELSRRRQAAGAEPLQFANLAVRGLLARPILGAQLDEALALRPDLISIVAGGNDLFRPDVNVNELVLRLERAVLLARRAGADVLLANSTDPDESPIISLTRGRAGVFYSWIWSIARRHGAHVVDLWGMRSLRDWRMWAPDRIHLSSEGHRRVAEAALVSLGLAPTDPDFDVPPAPAEPLALTDRAAWHASWLTGYAAPWMARRLRRRSSADGRRPKDTAYRTV